MVFFAVAIAAIILIGVCLLFHPEEKTPEIIRSRSSGAFLDAIQREDVTMSYKELSSTDPAQQFVRGKSAREQMQDPLLRYKRRYGICGHFSRRSRMMRRARGKRALEEAIRKQDLDRLQILHTLGVR